MIKNFICIVLALVVMSIVLGFSDKFQKIAEKHDRLPLGGTGTDFYLSCSIFLILVCFTVILYNGTWIIVLLCNFL